MIKYKNVYVVDDDKIYHFILKNILNKNKIGIIPSFFENGSDALDRLKETVVNGGVFPELILLDINMPIMDGWQFLAEFRKLKMEYNLETVVCLVTSSNDRVDMDKAKDYGEMISGYYVKPIGERDIFSIFMK